MKNILYSLLGLFALSQSAISQTRENFTLGGLSAFVITPDTPAPGNPWIAYAPSVGGLPSWTGGGAEAWMFDQYFAAGIAVAGIYSGDLSGNPAQRAGYTALYTELVGNRGYASKFSFHVRSRGGLLGYNWAADNPDKVAAIGGIYSVANLLSYPGVGTAASHYGISTSELTTNGHLYNPIERLSGLVANGICVFHIHGDSDSVVPIEANTQIVKDYFDANGGDATLTVIPGGGHDMNNHWWTNQPLTDFMIAKTLAAANTVGPPTLSSVVPADDSTDVTTSSNLVATFSEPIALTGSGTINLKNLSGGADIPVTLPGEVMILGAVLTINPASDLVGGEEYAVEISSDAIEDLESTPNAYAGLLFTDTPNWSFTAALPDLTNPTSSSMDPTAGESDVPPPTDLTLTFDEDVQVQTGNITIHLDSDDSVVETIDVTSGAVTISGAEVFIDISDLTANTSYYVNIAAGAFEDLSGNPFAGITGDTAWAFTTGDQPTPVAVVNPSFEDDDVGNNSFISSAIGWTTAGSLAGAQDYGDAQNPQPTDNEQHGFTNGGSSLSQVTPLTIAAGETYTLSVDVGQLSNFSGSQATIRLFGSTAGLGTALSNANGTAELAGMTPPSGGPYLLDQAVTYTALASGDPFEGQQVGIALIGASGTQVLFDNVRLETIAPSGPPTLNTSTSVVPADDSSGVVPGGNLEATFNKAIVLTGAGSIKLKNLSGGADVSITLPGEVSIVGAVLTINPSTDLVGGEEYAVEISSDAIEDLDATPNAYAGLLSTDTSNWSFTVGLPDLTGPVIDTLSPADDTTNVSPGTLLVVTFDEEIVIGTGNITIADLDTPAMTTIAVTDASQVSAAGGILTIASNTNLAPGTNYAIQIDATALDDTSGNSFAGIAGNITWNFSTGVPPAEEFTTTQLAYAGDVSSSDLLHGLTVIASGWNPAGGATPDNLNDGTYGTSYDDVATPAVATIAWTTVGATAEYNLGTGANGLGFDISSIQSIADWNSAAFGNQAYSVEVKPVGGSYTSLATVDYQPLTNAGGTKVTLTDPSGILASGIEFIKFTASSVNGGANGGAFTFREIDVFGSDTGGASGTFASWIDGYEVGGLTGFGDDADGDNLDNGLEAWFGTHPGEFSQGLTGLSSDGITMTVDHPQNENPPSELNAFYEWSPNLLDWYGSGIGPAGGATVTIVPVTTGNSTTVTATASEALTQLYLRIGVMQNAP